MGDTYAQEILSNGYLLEATEEWRDAYSHTSLT